MLQVMVRLQHADGHGWWDHVLGSSYGCPVQISQIGLIVIDASFENYMPIMLNLGMVVTNSRIRCRMVMTFMPFIFIAYGCTLLGLLGNVSKYVILVWLPISLVLAYRVWHETWDLMLDASPCWCSLFCRFGGHCIAMVDSSYDLALHCFGWHFIAYA